MVKIGAGEAEMVPEEPCAKLGARSRRYGGCGDYITGHDAVKAKRLFSPRRSSFFAHRHS